MPSPAKKYCLRLFWYLLGIGVMCLGLALVIRPGLGASPWDIFHLGVSMRLSVPLAFVVQSVGLLSILVNMTLGVRPSVGMVLNMLLVGPLVQLFLGILPEPTGLLLRWGMLGLGLLLDGFGAAWYISADLGAGPRDGLMLGLSEKLHLPVAVVKNSLDLCVALVGWWLGGPLGAGTVAVALGIGPIIQTGMFLIGRVSARGPLSGFVRVQAVGRR